MRSVSLSSTWTCPKCQRPFKHKHQAHSCVKIGPDRHFDNKIPLVKKIYDKLAGEIEKLGNVKVSSTKSSIMFVTRSTFLAVKPKKNWLDIEFLLDEVVNEYPIYKMFRANKSRVAHFVRLESPKDVNNRLIRLLKDSYRVTSEA